MERGGHGGEPHHGAHPNVQVLHQIFNWFLIGMSQTTVN
jgi:hypothetical protein